MIDQINTKKTFTEHIHTLQDEFCNAVEKTDGKATFTEDKWERPGGGGGQTRVIQNGNVFEKGGVNMSTVEGVVTDAMKKQLNIAGEYFFACGLSTVLHPYNPFVPTVHANFRYFELYDANKNIIDSWFGGGTDLTPYYLSEEDANHFHGTLKETCDKFDTSFYPKYKKTCDEYFVNTHRNNEARGIGGIFFDYLRPVEKHSAEFWLKFVIACSKSMSNAYLPIVEKRKGTPFTDRHKHWQEIRRGRYVEFNLLHDRGTLFGLKTNGRTESILMSLPPTVRYEYNYQPEKGTEEERLMAVLLQPRNWI